MINTVFVIAWFAIQTLALTRMGKQQPAMEKGNILMEIAKISCVIHQLRCALRIQSLVR